MKARLLKVLLFIEELNEKQKRELEMIIRKYWPR